MATIKVSKTMMNQIEDYIQKKYEIKSIKLTKKQVINRVVNLYHNLIVIDDLVMTSSKNECEYYRMVAIDDAELGLLKQDKQRLRKPIYMILDACLRQFFLNSKHKNVALCQFKGERKVYAFYFDETQLEIEKGQLVKVKTYNYENQTIVERVVKVRKLTYVEHAKEKHQPVIGLFNHNCDE